jgi:hypothetical protein
MMGKSWAPVAAVVVVGKPLKCFDVGANVVNSPGLTNRFDGTLVDVMSERFKLLNGIKECGPDWWDGRNDRDYLVV